MDASAQDLHRVDCTRVTSTMNAPPVLPREFCRAPGCARPPKERAAFCCKCCRDRSWALHILSTTAVHGRFCTGAYEPNPEASSSASSSPLCGAPSLASGPDASEADAKTKNDSPRRALKRPAAEPIFASGKLFKP